MVEYNFDSHKLIYHVDLVGRWLKGEDVYPIYMEISPAGACNHRCIFCAFDYLAYKPQLIDKAALLRTISELSGLGIKSIMFAGEGEPLLHPDMAEIILHTKEAGIDVALATNAVLLDKNKAKECLSALTWVRVSLNAGTKEKYAAIHGCNPQDFDKVMSNLTELVKLKKDNGYATTIGAQLILLPDNQEDLILLASLLKKIGLDYLTVKPYIQHPMSNVKNHKDLSDKELANLNVQLQKIATDIFKVVFRSHCMAKLKREKREYRKCYGLSFFTEIVSNGDVYACGPYLGDKEFCYGNIYHNTFSAIWAGENRRAIMKKMETDFNVNQCMKNCRMDEVNKYLWALKNPSPHVNFI